jgi:hypothetical protein
MKLSFAGVFADAGAMWRSERDLLLRLAGIFLFLPIFGLRLFLPELDVKNVAEDALWPAIAAWYNANALWLAAQLIFQAVGVATMLALLLDPARPTVGRALTRALGLLPSLMVGLAGIMLFTGLGAFLFILPGLYVLGRTLLVWPVLVSEPALGPFRGFAAAIQRTHKHGWMLLLALVTIWIPAYMVAGIFDASAASAGPLGKALVDMLVALISTAAGLAQLLVQAAAYRGLTAR